MPYLRALAFAIALTGCLRPSIQRTLELPESCRSWGRLPLTIALDESAEGYRRDINRAMKAWDAALGRPAFIWAYVTGAQPDVIVAKGPTRTPYMAAYTASECRNGAVLSAVLMRPFMDTSEATAFATHELGHVLGLGHSTNQQSVMQAVIDAELLGQWDDYHQPKTYRVTEADARLARALHQESAP